MAQKIDEQKMERDLEVAKNILGTLLKDNEHRGIWSSHSIQATYIDDYGVIITIPYTSSVMRLRGLTFSPGKDVVVVGGDGNNVVSVNVPKVEATKIDADSLFKAKSQQTIEAMRLFLADYGNLISQLGPEQKILITNRENNFRWSDNNRELSEISAEAKMSDLNDFKTGKISRSQLEERIKITNRTHSEEKSTDLELLSTIMGRLYRSDLSNTYYTNSSINYDRLADFGVIYRMQVYSSTSEGDNHRIITRDVDGLSQEERNNIVKEMYPDFIKGLKENIVEYGKTINSLKASEILMFQVIMTKCVGCNIPKDLEVSVKNQTLMDYSSGKISKAEALSRITVREGPMQ